MCSWILIFIVVPHSYGFQIRETEYECGAHGRFEYCIDGVPGCVIGCHCHPGYYFDTDTKICEPNIRLSQSFRRNFDMLEPTRVFLPPTPPVEEPATTVQNAVDEKIDIITKDADDLGDWLYNQFFKTIENQVINETKDDTIITRRSENAPTFIRKPTRRSHRYWRARRKKKKKKKGLKSKLLRITEDDSLFDSSSSSTSDESSDSSSSSVSEDTHENTKEKKIKKNHGHKKIVVYNKRPKPPLPSFIFLPNMETPFFPPIGLPPPPMPMYPMVPVPPMMGPYPFPAALTPCENEANKTNVDASTPHSQTDKTPLHTSTSENPSDDNVPEENPSDNKPPEENPADDIPPAENPPDGNPLDENPSEDKLPKHNAEPNQDNPEEIPPSVPRSRSKKRREPRNKLVQKLREKLKKKNKLQNYFANEYQGPPLIPPNFIPSNLPNMRQRPLPEMKVGEELATMQDVDFKYLSQLIHRADLNKTNRSLQTTTPTAQIKNVLTVPPQSRRNYYESYPDQITQVRSDLANQPKNHISEIQISYDSANQLTHSARNQPIYNAPIPNQPTYNVAIPNQPTYNAPNHPNYNTPNQPNYNAPNSNVPNQPTHNVPNQSSYNLPNQPTYNIPNQPSYNVANQPTYVSMNQPSHKIPYRKKIEDTNDGYYANLGRQIASMIRNIDGDNEVDIEITSSPNILSNPVLPGNSGSRSYWERSVRSPFKEIMNSFKKQINNLKLSNENLFSLENKVEIAASTEPTMSLHDLENVISKMHKAKSKFIRRNENSRRAMQSSKSSFNVNLLPGNHRQLHSNGKVNKRVQNTLPEPFRSDSLFKHDVYDVKNTGRQNVYSPLQPPPIRSSLLTDFMFTLEAFDEILNVTTPNTNTYKTNTYVPNIIPTRKPDSPAAPQLIYNMPNPDFKSYAYTVLPLPLKPPLLTNMQPAYMPATTRRTYYRQLSPMVLNHKAVKHYDSINNNQYIYEKASIPLRPQSFPSSLIAPVNRYETFGKRDEPSYFHHEVHHFDYFDDLL